MYAVESGSELILDNLAGCDSESPLPLLLRSPRRPCIDRSSRIQQLVRGVRSDLYIGDDTWPPPASVAADSNAISARDLNGDGKLDFVLSDRSVLLGNGDRTFQAALMKIAPGEVPLCRGKSNVVAGVCAAFR